MGNYESVAKLEDQPEDVKALFRDVVLVIRDQLIAEHGRAFDGRKELVVQFPLTSADATKLGLMDMPVLKKKRPEKRIGDYNLRVLSFERPMDLSSFLGEDWYVAWDGRVIVMIFGRIKVKFRRIIGINNKWGLTNFAKGEFGEPKVWRREERYEIVITGDIGSAYWDEPGIDMEAIMYRSANGIPAPKKTK
jgi:hypothetical protein